MNECSRIVITYQHEETQKQSLNTTYEVNVRLNQSLRLYKAWFYLWSHRFEHSLVRINFIKRK